MTAAATTGGAAQAQPVHQTNNIIPMTNTMDRAEFSAFIRDHHRGLIAYARAICGDTDRAKDIVQEALVTAYKNLGKFDVARDFGAWMRGIVRNKCREEARKKKAEPMDDEILEKIEGDAQEWSAFNPADGLFDSLSRCLDRLPDNMRAAIDACYYTGQTSAEAAPDLGTTEASVRKRLQRARESLRDCLGTKAAALSS